MDGSKMAGCAAARYSPRIGSLLHKATIPAFLVAMTVALSGEAVAQPPAIFVIDSTNTLFSFTKAGAPVARTPLPGIVKSLCGGGITRNGVDLYVTLCSKPQVVVFNALTLQQIVLPKNRFSGLNTARGIVYDGHNQGLYVGNGGPINPAVDFEYSRSGRNMNTLGLWPGYYGPSGVAYDGQDNTIWVSNFFGGAWSGTPEYGVSEYNEDGTVFAAFDYATQFVPPTDIEEEQPYSIAFCPATKTLSQNLVVVGFTSVDYNLQRGQVQSYTTAGAPMGSRFFNITNANGLSCWQPGFVFVADQAGLLLYHVTGGPQVNYPGDWFVGLTPPIFGVYAN